MIKKVLFFAAVLISFVTEAKLGEPTQLGGDFTVTADVDMDENGNAFILWHGFTSPCYLRATKVNLTSGMQSTHTLITSMSNTCTGGMRKRIATNDTGSAIAVWTETISLTLTTFETNIYAAYYNGSFWGNAEKLNTEDLGLIVNSFDVGMDDNGNGIVVWTQPETAGLLNTELMSRRFQINLGWQAEENINILSQGVLPPSIVVDREGNAIVHWSNNWSRFTIDSSTNTGIWGAVQQLPTTLVKDRIFKVNNTGTIVVISGSQNSLGSNTVQSALYTPGMGWGGAEEIHPDLGHHADIAINDSKNAVAVWVEIDSSTNPSSYYLKSSIRIEDTGWGAVKTIRTVTAGYSISSIKVAIDNDNNTSVVWNEGKTGSRGAGVNDSDGAIYVKYYNQTDGWSSEKQVSLNKGLSNFVYLASNSSGQLLAAWSQIDSGPAITAQKSWISVGETDKDPNLSPGKDRNEGDSGDTDESNMAASSGGGTIHPSFLIPFIILLILRRHVFTGINC